MSTAKWMIRTCVAAAFALLAWGCSSANEKAPAVAENGRHPANWIQTHWEGFSKNPDGCRTCHGSTTDPAQAGGISKVSCFSCHPDGASHQPGWEAGSRHGRLGAMLEPSATKGFSHCAQCHGSMYDNGANQSCRSCHTKAPHPDRPWRGSTEASPNHDKVDPKNASECAKCHTNGAHSTRVPTSPAPDGAPASCYNNTLCHDKNP